MDVEGECETAGAAQWRIIQAQNVPHACVPRATLAQCGRRGSPDRPSVGASTSLTTRRARFTTLVMRSLSAMAALSRARDREERL